MQKLLTILQQNMNVIAIFEERNFNVRLASNFLKF